MVSRGLIIVTLRVICKRLSSGEVLWKLDGVKRVINTLFIELRHPNDCMCRHLISSFMHSDNLQGFYIYSLKLSCLAQIDPCNSISTCRIVLKLIKIHEEIKTSSNFLFDNNFTRKCKC